MTENQYQIVRLSVVTLSILFGIWQHVQRVKAQKLFSHTAMQLNRNIGIGLGAAQDALENSKKGINPDSEIGRSIGLLNASLVESAALYCFLKNPDLIDIQEMVDQKQIPSQFQNVFNTFSKTKSGFISRNLKKLKNWFK